MCACSQEGARILEDQLRMMDEKYRELRANLDVTRANATAEVKRVKTKADRLRMVRGLGVAACSLWLAVVGVKQCAAWCAPWTAQHPATWAAVSDGTTHGVAAPTRTLFVLSRVLLVAGWCAVCAGSEVDGAAVVWQRAKRAHGLRGRPQGNCWV